MALTDSQVDDVLEGMFRHSPNDLVRLAITRVREWRTSVVHYKQQIADLHRENAELREKLREALNEHP